MKPSLASLSPLLLLVMMPLHASAAVTVLDDFETNEGHFERAPTFSGSTLSILPSSTADRVTTEFFSGSASQMLVLNDNPAAAVPPAVDPPGGAAWVLRHVSGSGTPGNNVSIPNTPTTWIGYYLKTTATNLEASLMIDDGVALEMAVYQPIIADGLWHLYQFQLSDAASWEPFAGTGANGAIDAATVTIDALHLRAMPGAPATATIYFDYLVFDTAGPIPEPGSAALLGLSLAGLARRRRPV